MRGTPLGIRLLTRLAAAVAATVTWDSANSSTDWTLSGSNLIATRNVTTAGFWALLRATSAKASGTVTVTVNSVGSTVNDSVGFDVAGETVNLGGTDHSIGWVKAGQVVYNTSTVATYGAWTTGDVLKFVKAGKDISFYLNGALQGSLDVNALFLGTSPVTGAVFPAASSGNSTGLQLTIDGSLWV